MIVKDIRTSIAAEVRAAIARAGRSHRDVAIATGIAPSALSRKLRGDVSFSVEELIAVANALDVSVAAFLPKPQALAA